MLTVAEVAEVIARPKELVSYMAWTSKSNRATLDWLEARMAVRFLDELEVHEQFFVCCQWRKRDKDIPENWTFNLMYQGVRIYALHVQPLHRHTNKIGKGRHYYKEIIEDTPHEHIWVDEGDGYAEPINVPLDRPDIIWKMFLARVCIIEADFFHPDQGEPELAL